MGATYLKAIFCSKFSDHYTTYARASLWDMLNPLFGCPCCYTDRINAPDGSDGGYFYGYSDERELSDGGPGASTYLPGNGAGEFCDAITTQGYLKATLRLAETSYQYPYAGIGVDLTYPRGVADLSSKTGFCLLYYSTKALRLELDGDYGSGNLFNAIIPASTHWTVKNFAFDPSTFQQEPGRGTAVELTHALASSTTGIHFRLYSPIPDTATAVFGLAQIGFTNECSVATFLTEDLIPEALPGSAQTKLATMPLPFALRIQGHTAALTLERATQGTLDVMDVRGNVQLHLTQGLLETGEHRYPLASLPQGLYFLRWKTTVATYTMKVVL